MHLQHLSAEVSELVAQLTQHPGCPSVVTGSGSSMDAYRRPYALSLAGAESRRGRGLPAHDVRGRRAADRAGSTPVREPRAS